MDNDVELQDRFINRLKNIKQFQGAYHELMISNIFIRGGYSLVLENESDNDQRHCEFSAISKDTGEKYWVEAKMRGVSGVLGKTTVDGSKNNDPTSQITTHLKNAMGKPAADKRMIFIDVNSEQSIRGEKPPWMDRARKRLLASEKDKGSNENAYIFVTNLPFHHYLDDRNILTFWLRC